MYSSLLFLPLLGFFVPTLFGRFLTRSTVLYLNILSMVTAITLCLTLLLNSLTGGSTVVVIVNDWINLGLFSVSWTLLYDNLTLCMVLLVLVISTFVHLYSWEYMGEDPHFLRFISYLSIFSFFMLLFVTAGNFLQMFFGWEGVGLSSYLLINFWYTRLQANKSAMKAIIVNRISDCFLYFSLFLLFLIFGTLDYSLIFSTASILNINTFWLNTIMFCIFIGAVGKSAQLGLHTWLPDAMEGPTPVSALLHAATMVTAGVYLLIRCSILLELVPSILLLVALIGALTTFFAGTVGCFQNDIKKIIAYSTCSQLGYMFLVTGLGQFNVSFFHLFNHAFFKALLFLGAGSVIHALLDEQDIRKMGGLFVSLPITFISFTIGSLALAGIPYLTGFYSKDLLIELTFSTYSISSVFLYWMALSSVFFTAFYSTRLAYYVFMGWANYQTFKVSESGNIILFVLICLSLLSLFVGFLGKDFFVGAGTDFWGLSINSLLINNTLFDTELGFVFSGIYALNKLIPLLLTFTSAVVAVLLLSIWPTAVINKPFRIIYEFINQKWYFDVIYLNFIVVPIITAGYTLMFKLLDRGVFEAFGSVALSNNVYFIFNNISRYFETGNLYTYSFIQILFLVVGSFFCLY